MLFKKIKKYEVYDGIEGVKRGNATVVRENGVMIGFNISEDGGKVYFVPTTEVEFLDESSIIIYPEWLRSSIETLATVKEFSHKYPHVKSPAEAGRIKEIVDYQNRIHETIRNLEKTINELQKMKESIPIEVAKLVGRRMIGDIDFFSFSKEVENYERKYKILSKNIEKSKKIIEEIKNSPFYIKESISLEFKSIVEDLNAAKSKMSDTKAIKKKTIDEDGVLRISPDELKTIDEFLLSFEKKQRKKESR